MSTATYEIAVDWDNSGTYDGGNEDVTSATMSVSFWRGRATEMDKAEPGGCTIVLRDTNGTYVPENTGSALYGSLLPGRPVRVRATFLAVTYDLFNGFIDDIIPDPDPHIQRATLLCVDGFDQLRRKKISMSVQSDVYSGIAGGAATGIIYTALTTAGWPAAARTLDNGVETYPQVYAQKQRALDFLQAIEQSEFAFMYIGHDGYFNFEDRHYRLTNARCTASQWTITAADYSKFTPIQPLSRIRNTVTITAYPKTKAVAVATLWTLQDTGADSPLVGPNESKVFVAHFADANGLPNIADDVVTPTIVGADDDYHAFSDTAEAGTDLSANCSITALVDDTNLFADRAEITVTNTGTVSFYLTKLIVRGKIFTDEGKLEILSEDATSVTAYNIRDYDANLPFYQNAASMQGIADQLVYTYKDPIPIYEFTVANRTDALLTQILDTKLSDRVTLQNATLNIDDDFFVEHMRHEITGAGKVHRARFILSKVDSLMYWILDTSQLCETAASEYAFPTVIGY